MLLEKFFLNIKVLFRAGLEQLTMLQVAYCERFAAAFWIARCNAPVSAWVDEMNAGNRTSWVSLTVGEHNTLRTRIPFTCIFTMSVYITELTYFIDHIALFTLVFILITR